MPHKARLARLAIERGWALDLAARATGVANTLVVRRGEAGDVVSMEVLNTDAAAVTEALAPALQRFDDKRVGVIGAGGMARSAAYALGLTGATVVVYARDPDKARDLARSLEATCPGRIVAASLDLLPRACCDAFVNCTPLGMAGTSGAGLPALPAAEMRSSPARVVVLDTVYRPRETPTLAAARSRGWEVIDGGEVFVRQAIAQSVAWTGRRPPAGLVERLVRSRLEEGR
jgi:shikimate dehydrogenase